MTAVVGETYPAAGVMVARPATAPVRSPRNFGFLEINHSTAIQVTAANDAAMSVFRNALAVTASTRNSLPALNPYQPNQRGPVPRATRGMRWDPRSWTLRFPTYKTDARAAIPTMF